MIDKLWDDVVAGPPPSPEPETGLDKLRRRAAPTQPLAINTALATGGEASKSMPTTPTTPPVTPRGSNVWRSVFHPGSNLATKNLGANLFDRPPQPNSPTVYDWLYSNETRARSIHR